MGYLGGLLLKRPVYYDNYKTGVLFRDFESLSDINETEKVVDEVIEVDHLLSKMPINIKQKNNRFITWKNTLLTLWGRHHLRAKEGLTPLTEKQFKRLHKTLFHETKKGNVRCIDPKIKTSFLNWIIAQTGLSDTEISDRIRQTLENLFDEIENEYKDVAINDLDPRFINLFLVKKPTS